MDWNGIGNRVSRRGFTLIELLVVIAIIALLIGILLPSLSSARRSAQAVIVASNARSVTQADVIYLGNNKDLHPPSYVYGEDRQTTAWNREDQQNTNPNVNNGYVHWSYLMFDGGDVPQDAFESPVVLNRGAPRTNPGSDPEHWEAGQLNDLRQGEGSDWPEDRQVPRLAFAGNAAILARNKFNLPSNYRRRARLVKNTKIARPSKTILFTEFRETSNWASLADPDDGESIIKSHRPITPFRAFGFGRDVYRTPDRAQPSFEYPTIEELQSSLDSITGDQTQLIVGSGGSNSSLEAVNNHFDGKAHFAYLDGHVELEFLIETVRDRQWGDQFYSITGNGKLRKNVDDDRP